METLPFIGESKLICISDSNKLRELYDLIISNKNQPFRTFELWCFPIDFENQLVSQHISTCGPFFHHLTLNFDKESENLLKVRTLRDLFLYYLPNLRTLSLRQLPNAILSQKWIFPPEGASKFRQPLFPSLKSLKIYSDGDYNSDFLSNILSSTLNLKEIIVEYGDEPRNFKKTLLSAIFDSSLQLRNLESLKYFMHDPGSGDNWAWTPEECVKLAELNFPLRSLKLHPAGQAETRTVFQLLTTLKSTLQNLKLRVHDQLRCPRMTQLTSLILYDYEGSLVFLDQLPNLNHLGLCEYSPAKFLTPENIVSAPHDNLKSLNLYGSSYTVSNHLFYAISKVFTNLRVLNYWHMSNDKLKTVIENFPLLEELVINVVGVDDEGMTGFPLDLCEQIERLGNYSEYMKRPENFRIAPFIGNLCSMKIYKKI